ncbi:unnamed protein product, partial [marine sediment metagenome]
MSEKKSATEIIESSLRSVEDNFKQFIDVLVMESLVDKKDLRFYKRMIILIILLVISLSYLAYDRSVSYTKGEFRP